MQGGMPLQGGPSCPAESEGIPEKVEEPAEKKRVGSSQSTSWSLKVPRINGYHVPEVPVFIGQCFHFLEYFGGSASCFTEEFTLQNQIVHILLMAF